MKKRTYLILGFLILALLLVYTYGDKGDLSGEDAKGLLSCASPTEPQLSFAQNPGSQEQAQPSAMPVTGGFETVSDPGRVSHTTTKETEPDDSPAAPLTQFDIKNNNTVQLWAGGVHYAAGVGRVEWRATFETRVILKSGENILKECDVKYYWQNNFTRPELDDGRWISGKSMEEHFPHGLISIDGHWLDREDPDHPRPPWWIRAHVIDEEYNIDINVIGRCGFYEAAERSDRQWDPDLDLIYGVGDRILDIAKFE